MVFPKRSIPAEEGRPTLPFNVITGNDRSISRLDSDSVRRHLRKHGAVLLRNVDIRELDDFRSFVEEFSPLPILNYSGGASPRSNLNGNIYTSTEYPPELELSLHNELSYSTSYPSTLFFFCVEPAPEGGETTMGDSRRILARMDPGVVSAFRSRGLLYVRNLVSDPASQYSWQCAFETARRERVEEVCAAIGARIEWQPDESLKMFQTGSATVFHPQTNEEVWFNQAEGFYAPFTNAGTREPSRLECYFGDGSEIPIETIEHIREVIRSETIPHQWQTSDLLIVDNLLAAHGRRPFSGRRKIVLAMA
jgi:alpha-ketoglutarate-dependent taurine dioxygenase